jgi:hypothetical protein
MYCATGIVAQGNFDMPKPQHFNEYATPATELAERVLLEVWSKLGEFRSNMVLVGGLVPRYLVDQSMAQKKGNLHCGTMDVDLGVSIAVADVLSYRSIRKTLEEMGFRPGKNKMGREQLHSFVKKINGIDVNVDFLTTRYEGPSDTLMREVESNLRAIQIEGLGLALESPLSISVEGELLSGGYTTEKVNICRSIPFIVLKTLAFDNRREPKDVYDMLYVLLNSDGGALAVAKSVTPSERRQVSFQRAMDVLRNRFSDISRDGPVKYAQFVEQSGAEATAFATVMEFLSGL